MTQYCLSWANVQEADLTEPYQDSHGPEHNTVSQDAFDIRIEENLKCLAFFHVDLV